MKVVLKAAVSRRYRQKVLLLAAAFAVALAGAGAAQAFTLLDQDGNSAGSGSMFLDRDGKTPKTDAPASRFGTGTTTIQQGNGTLRFGGNSGSFNQRYNSNNLFDPYARDGR
jgi:hypothetical protein